VSVASRLASTGIDCWIVVDPKQSLNASVNSLNDIPDTLRVACNFTVDMTLTSWHVQASEEMTHDGKLSDIVGFEEGSNDLQKHFAVHPDFAARILLVEFTPGHKTLLAFTSVAEAQKLSLALHILLRRKPVALEAVSKSRMGLPSRPTLPVVAEFLSSDDGSSVSS